MTVPTVRAGLAVELPPADRPSVSVIIPAHNEQRVIEACARGLLAQDYGPLEVIFVLDRCTDRTQELLDPIAERHASIRIVRNATCPESWAGKCHAAAVGVGEASGDWLLFTDADTQFDPGLVRAAVAMADQRGVDLLSLLSTLTTANWYERIVQPVAGLALLNLYPMDRVNNPTDSRAFANGQFMLFRREMYERIGGHEAVKDDLLEDIAFARLVNRCGGRGGLLLADGMLVCAMYDSFNAFRTGWKRIFIESCRRRVKRIRKHAVRMLVTGLLLPAAHMGLIVMGMLCLMNGNVSLGWLALVGGILAWVVQTATLAWAYRLGGTPAIAAVTYPIGSWLLVRILFEAASDLARRAPIRWGGRDYVLEPRT